MQTLVLNWNDIASGQPMKDLKQAFARTGTFVVTAESDNKVRKSVGIKYKTLFLSFSDGQKVSLDAKEGGDVFSVRVNNRVVPIKNHDNLKKAILEIINVMDKGRKRFQAAQARVKVELPKGLKTTARKKIDVLTDRHAELDIQIAEATEKRDALRKELGMTSGLDSVDDSAFDYGGDNKFDDYTEALDAARKNNQKSYKFYVVVDGFIISGWDYKEDAKESIAEDELPPKLRAKKPKILTGKTLKQTGKDPDDNASWYGKLFDRCGEDVHDEIATDTVITALKNDPDRFRDDDTALDESVEHKDHSHDNKAMDGVNAGVMNTNENPEQSGEPAPLEPKHSEEAFDMVTYKDFEVGDNAHNKKVNRTGMVRGVGDDILTVKTTKGTEYWKYKDLEKVAAYDCGDDVDPAMDGGNLTDEPALDSADEPVFLNPFNHAATDDGEALDSACKERAFESPFNKGQVDNNARAEAEEAIDDTGASTSVSTSIAPNQAEVGKTRAFDSTARVPFYSPFNGNDAPVAKPNNYE
jgi:hypothetical protein